ncbi:MAG: hypothetical protein KGN84_01235 [Acidobacteriota bacterium]|nr:hypothetical protein [Acidobacteriota bacterium]
MALFVDGPTATIDDLSNQDSGFLEVAQTCGINATIKLALAHEELATDLELWLEHSRPTGVDWIWHPVLRIDQVVITPAMTRWETMQTLSLFYRDAYFSQFADRYQSKWDEYAALTRAAYEKFLAAGMGLVGDPIRRAAPPDLSSIPGPQKGGMFYASLSWTNATGQEGEPSSASSIAIPDGNLMTVSAVNPPANAVGFNVYAGASLDGLYLQNEVALPLNGSFTFVPGFVSAGRLPGCGQKPDFVRPLRRTFLRG